MHKNIIGEKIHYVISKVDTEHQRKSGLSTGFRGHTPTLKMGLQHNPDVSEMFRKY